MAPTGFLFFTCTFCRGSRVKSAETFTGTTISKPTEDTAAKEVKVRVKVVSGDINRKRGIKVTDAYLAEFSPCLRVNCSRRVCGKVSSIFNMRATERLSWVFSPCGDGPCTVRSGHLPGNLWLRNPEKCLGGVRNPNSFLSSAGLRRRQPEFPLREPCALLATLFPEGLCAFTSSWLPTFPGPSWTNFCSNAAS